MSVPTPMTAYFHGLSVGDLRAIRTAGHDPAAIAALRRADLLTPTNGVRMSENPPDLTADELAAARLAGMTPERYAAIRDTPRTSGGSRSVTDVLAAGRRAEAETQETSR